MNTAKVGAISGLLTIATSQVAFSEDSSSSDDEYEDVITSTILVS